MAGAGAEAQRAGARRLSVPASPRRYSGLGVPGAGAGAGARRLSSLVPEAVVRRLSSSLGLARPAPPECLVEQGKALCVLYMRSRVRAGAGAWAGAGARAAAVARLAAPWAGARCVFPRLSLLGRHLERARPRLFAAVGRHARLAPPAPPGPPGPPARPPPDPADIVYGIGEELFKSDITWGKVVSLMAVCGALASDARGSPDLAGLLDAAAAVMRGPLLPWLVEHGGWYGLLEHCQPMESEAAPTQPPDARAAALLVLLLLLLLVWLKSFFA